MRSCDEIVELLSASLDGQLTADEQTALDEHIACCPACSALLDDLRALHAASADWEDVPAPAGFAESVMKAVAAETAPKNTDNVIFFTPGKTKRNPWKKWGLSAAAIAIVVLGAVSAPSLMGNFSAKESAADVSVPRNAAPAEAMMDAVDDQYMYSTESSVEAQGKAETAPAEKPVASTAPDNSAKNFTCGEAFNPEHYVGELILEGPLKILEVHEGAACSDGTVTYLVPAEVFAEVFNLLEAEKPVGYYYTAGNPNAELGKIIVQSN